MKSNPKQKAVYLALCILAAIVVWIFVDNSFAVGTYPDVAIIFSQCKHNVTLH